MLMRKPIRVVINPTEKEVKLKPKTVVGTLSSVRVENEEKLKNKNLKKGQ